MRYMTLFTPHCTVRATVDLRRAKRAELIDFIYLVDKFDQRPYLSNYKNLLNAPFKRIAASSNPVESRRIALSDAPVRLTDEQAFELLEKELRRRRQAGREKRKVHPNSLANLRPAAPFEPGRCHHKRVSKVSSESLNLALERRNNGCSWRQVGDHLRLPASTIRSALRRAGLLTPDQAGDSSQ
jgi:hypothetical protein